MNFKIVADSSADILNLDGVDFASAPLKIITTDKEYVDDARLDVLGMVEELKNYKGRSSTSCPNPADWLEAFGDADRIFCITITGTLSGAYNSACAAKAEYENEYSNRKVFVINSLTTGPEIGLIADKIKNLIDDNEDFEDICHKITEYTKHTHLLFMLESMKNLANNGRVNAIVAKMAGLLGIRVVGKASDKGDLEPLNKCRGEQKALETLFENMKTLGFKGTRVKIAHCFNENAALKLKGIIKQDFPQAEVTLNCCRGLCSFYAEKGGLLVGFETV